MDVKLNRKAGIEAPEAGFTEDAKKRGKHKIFSVLVFINRGRDFNLHFLPFRPTFARLKI